MTNDTHRDHGASAGEIGLVTVILALIFLFVWPGPLRYEYMWTNRIVRIDRLTGKVSMLQDGKYVRVIDMTGGELGEWKTESH